ncbi:MAG: hypothetical protein H6555_12415 [Lewinellaceae bacterium]|nr:hypothetical protein [Lewinellaceae bacterium]
MLPKFLLFSLLISTTYLAAQRPEARALDGRKLYPSPLSAKTQHRYDSLLAIAQADYATNPQSLDNIIWLGRRTAYLGRYREAIRIFSKGMKLFPASPELYRHRGHRYLSIREFDKAIADFAKAADLAKNWPIEIEPDGLPNAMNIPLSSLQFNIWYHWALAYYLKGDFTQAASLFKTCLEKYSDNDDSRAAAADWLYMCYQRANAPKLAQGLLASLPAEMTIIENDAYYQRLRMYRGLQSPDALLQLDRIDDPDNLLNLVTQGYGVANWYFYNQEPARAQQILEKILATSYWSAFGYIAAEADWVRLQKKRK